MTFSSPQRLHMHIFVDPKHPPPRLSFPSSPTPKLPCIATAAEPQETQQTNYRRSKTQNPMHLFLLSYCLYSPVNRTHTCPRRTLGARSALYLHYHRLSWGPGFRIQGWGSRAAPWILGCFVRDNQSPAPTHVSELVGLALANRHAHGHRTAPGLRIVFTLKTAANKKHIKMAAIP